MEFDIHKPVNPNINRFDKDALKSAYDFSKRMHEEFGEFIKAIVLFGSVARKQKGYSSDIDMLVITDDVTQTLSQEVVQVYRILVKKIVATVDIRLHVTTIRLSTFWEYVRAGDPVSMNMLRDGVALLDTGFFDPLRALLLRGRIKPSKEAIWSYFSRAPRTLHNAQWHILQATLDLYWACIDATHAALMKQQQIPPSPEYASTMLQEHLVEKGLLPKKYAATMKKFYDLQKDITHRRIISVEGKDFDKLKQEAEDMVAALEKIVLTHPEEFSSKK